MPQVKVGIVVSTKMQKAVVVKVESQREHPLYKKKIKRTTKIKAHDDIGVKVGQNVKIVETKPFSAHINFKVLEVIE